MVDKIHMEQLKSWINFYYTLSVIKATQVLYCKLQSTDKLQSTM